jgi:hypothetical protein
MSDETRSSEWFVRSGLAIDAGEGFAAGISFFDFANAASKIIHHFRFVGLGFGVEGKGSGKGEGKGFRMSKLPASLADGSWEELKVLREFNGDDLHNSGGEVLRAGAAAGVGFEAVLITGGISVFHEVFFRLNLCKGMILGLGAGASILAGLWRKFGEEPAQD